MKCFFSIALSLWASFVVALAWSGDADDRDINKLMQQLSSDNPLVQVRAAQSLWKLEEPAETLLPTLVKILIGFEPDSEREPLDEFFFHDDVPARIAIELLGEIGPEAKSAIPALLAAVDNPRLAIRFPAVDALGAIGVEAAPEIKRLDRALRDSEVYSYPFAHRGYCLSDQAAIALRRIGPASTNVLLSALDDQDARVRANAANALGYLPGSQNKAIAALVKLLNDPHESVRAMAACALGRIGPPAARAAPNLAAHLNDAGQWTSYPGGGIGSTFTVGDHIQAALRSISPEPKSVVPAIEQELKESGRMSHAMCEMLRRLGPEAKAVVPAIEPLLGDPENGRSAALALARIVPDHDGLLERLRTSLVKGKFTTMLDAARGLGDLGGGAVAALPDLYAQLERNSEPSAKAILAAAIVKIDRRQSRAVIALATGLQESSGLLRFVGHDEAAATWSTLGADAQPAIEGLIEGVKVRLRGAELLIDVSVHRPEVIDSLIRFCQMTDAGHRVRAADALGRMGPTAEKAASVLVHRLADRERHLVDGDFYGNGGTHFEPGERAALALVKIGAPAVPALRAALKDDRPAVRRHAAQALGAIGQSARPAVADLVFAVKDQNRSVRAAAAEALGKIGDTDDATIAVLIHAIVDKHLAVRVATATALGRLGPGAKQAVSELSKLQNDPFELARSAAVEALRRIR